MTHYIELQQNIQVIGAAGIGKTFKARSLIREWPHLYVSCSERCSKQEVLRSVTLAVQALTDSPSFLRLAEFIDYLPTLRK